MQEMEVLIITSAVQGVCLSVTRSIYLIRVDLIFV